jgi:hypothetical protein
MQETRPDPKHVQTCDPKHDKHDKHDTSDVCDDK